MASLNFQLKKMLSSSLRYTISTVLVILAGCSGSPVIPEIEFATLSVRSIETLSNPPHFAYDMQIAINPVTGEIFSCWVKKVDGVSEVHWRHGYPGAFSSEEIITVVDGYRSFNPALVAGADGLVHFAYMNKMPDGYEKEVFARTWDNGMWTGEVRLSDPDIWTAWDPDIEVYPDGRPVVCWFDHRFNVQHEILLRIGDGQGNWEPYDRITDDDHWQADVDMEIDSGGIVHFAYADTRHMEDPNEWEDTNHLQPGRNFEIYYRTWDGAAPGPETRVTHSDFKSKYPQIDVDNEGTVHIIWLDEPEIGRFQLFYTKIKSGQVGEIIAVSDETRLCDHSDIICFMGRVFIVYPEYIDPVATPNDTTELFIREVLGDGRMGEPLLLAGDGTSLHPIIADDPSRSLMWVGWMRYEGNDETLRTGESSLYLCSITVEE